jgi:hypothetical protein
MPSRTARTATLTIPRRFNGPPESGNGGYVSGLLAGLFDGPARVTLRRPIPLGVQLQVERSDDRLELCKDDATLAITTQARIDLEPPVPPTWGEAVDASLAYVGFTQHPFPTCFVCGTNRAEGDGLRIFPGPVSELRQVAAPWLPADNLADGDGLVAAEFVWAALDCATGWATNLAIPIDKVVVLGTLGVAIRRRPQAGRRHVLAAWLLRHEGRKFLAAAALWSESGELAAIAEATWIQISQEDRKT